MELNATAPAPIIRQLPPPVRKEVVPAGKSVPAMMPDSVELALRNDTIAQLQSNVGVVAVENQAWDKVVYPFRRAVSNATSLKRTLEVYDDICKAAVAAQAAAQEKRLAREPEEVRKLVAIRGELYTAASLAAQLACAFATTQAEVLSVIERMQKSGGDPGAMPLALERAVTLGTSVNELLEVANMAKKLGHPAIVASAAEKALKCVGTSIPAILDVAQFACENGLYVLAARACEKLRYAKKTEPKPP